MLLRKCLALAWALLMAGVCDAQTNTTEWPIHNDGLTTLVEWYVDDDDGEEDCLAIANELCPFPLSGITTAS